MDGELLSLKWNNHRTTFYHIISGLRNKESYTDVTLACDGKFYPTHKFVLSTCSQYFQEIFDRTPCKNPVVVLKDIQCRDLEFLLDYMYIGEVNVRQNELTSLIKAAECLRVKGLAVPDEEPKKSASSSSVSNSERHRPEQSSPPAKRRRAEERRIAPIVTDQSPGRPPGDRLGSPDRRDTQSSKADGSACDEGQGDRSDLIVIKEEKEDTQDDVVNVQNSYDGGDDDGDGPHDSEGNTNEFPEFLQSTIEKEEPVAISEFNPDFPGPSGLQNSGLNPWEGENSTTSFPEGLSGAVAAAVAAAAQPQQRQQQLVDDSTSSGLAGPGVADVSTGLFTCSVCGHVCASRSEWRWHCCTAHSPSVTGRYRCRFCSYCTNDRSNFRRHLAVHTGVKNFRCPRCGRRSNDRSNMKKHFLRCVANAPVHALN
ncbi:protein tramtrack, beta isoform-like isoform X11 [Macrobrachium rosenbergii]|uniref:protein tramtrack, beta isoform-like isoform X11 n=1 Tax=Macrobrachium rosenbergii TaxID=79674 RepID=UPI0034D423E6